jgi:hypothetical protein
MFIILLLWEKGRISLDIPTDYHAWPSMDLTEPKNKIDHITSKVVQKNLVA